MQFNVLSNLKVESIDAPPPPQPISGTHELPPAQDAGGSDTSDVAQLDANLSLPPERFTIDARSGLYRRSTSRRGSRSRHSSQREASPAIASREPRRDRRRQLWVTRLAALAAIVASVILSMMLIRAEFALDAYIFEGGMLASQLKSAQGELEQAKQLIAAQEVELGALVKQRIPGVTRVENDQLYEIDNQYVKKLSFTETGIGADRRLAYYAVLKNSSEVAILPAVTILLFDHKGLQTGMARLTHDAATTPTDHDQLQPGETRAYSAPIDAIRKDAPAYFTVEVR
jgi:hypothetical protein